MTRKDVARSLTRWSVSAAISAAFFTLPAAAQPAPEAAPPPAAAPPAAAPGPGAAPPADAPPSEQAPSAGTLPPPAPADAPPAPPPGAEPPANDLIPPGEEAAAKPRPVDAAKMEFKPGRGLSIKSADGDFELAMRTRAQFLYTIQDGNIGRADGSEATEQIFEIRRLRLNFQGTAFGKHNRYYVELGVGGREVQPAAATVSPLLDAYAEFDHLRDLTFRVGQYKPSFGRQRVMSEGNLQLVDVSTVTREFTFDREVGLDFRSKDFLGLNMLRYVVGVYTGQGRNSFNATEFKMLYLARVEVLPLGLYEDYQEADFDRAKPRLSIGLNAGHIAGNPRVGGVSSPGSLPPEGGTTDMTLLQADAQFKVVGVSAQTEFFYRKASRNADGAAGEPVTAARGGLGWYAQAGYLLPGMPLELSARYGMTRKSSTAGEDGQTDWNELGGGLGYYFARHPLKVQSDFFRIWDNANTSIASNYFRLQLQVAL